MSTALKTSLRSLSTPRPSHIIRLFSSTDDGLAHPNQTPEPTLNRPWRSHKTHPCRSPKYNHRDSRIKNEIDADFLERFRLGFDRKSEDPKEPTAEIGSQSTEQPISPPEDADGIFKKMKETGLIPNAVAMLDGLCKDGLTQEAMKLFGAMREKGTIPEVVVYTAVVEGFCKAHKFDDAIRIFRKMQGNGVSPNAFGYQVLIRGLCGGTRLEEARGFAVEMLEAGHAPNMATFTGLVDGFCRERGLEEALGAIDEMKLKGFAVEERAATEYLEKKGPFTHLVWEAILGKKVSKRSLF